MNKLQELKSKIHEILPEILEEKLNCVVEITPSKKRLSCEKFKIIISKKIDEYCYKDVDGIFWEHCNYKILGRDITLEDVLMVIGKYDSPISAITNYDADKVLIKVDKNSTELWTLGKPLNDQPQETINFLHQIMLRDAT